MQILLIAATEKEISLFNNVHSEIDVLITGVGIPATLYHLQKKIHTKEYDLIIQAGIAGAFGADISLGEAFLVAEDTFADLGIEEKEIFIPIFKSALANAATLPFTNGWLVNNSQALLKKTTLPWARAITINKISDSILQKKQLEQVFAPQLETMEGAALHYVCLQEDIPFIQIRSVSNYVGERDKQKWKMNEALKNLNIALNTLINQLTN
jgi:futalosine hydrolase